VRALEDKQRLIEDILRLAPPRTEDGGSSASSLSAGSSSASGGGCGATRSGAAEVLLTALTQGWCFIFFVPYFKNKIFILKLRSFLSSFKIYKVNMFNGLGV
jgi:hypothetical protein